MASEHYKTDSDVLPADIVAELRAAVEKSGVVTFREDGDFTPSEARLGPVLAAIVRANLPWDQAGAATSMVVYVAKPRDEQVERVVQALGAEHSPAALATALGVSRDTVYRKRKVPRTVGHVANVLGDPSALIAGLAAIRRRERIEQASVAQMMGVSVTTLVNIERDERADAERAEQYLRAMSRSMRTGAAHLRRQAVEAGIALRAIRALPVPS